MAKQIKTLEDAQRTINDLYGQLENLRTKSQDLHGNRVTNAGDAQDPQDYVTLAQITAKNITPETEYRYRTIVLTKDGTVTTGEDSPGDIIGDGIDGTPHQVWVCCEPGFEPSGGDLIINVAWTRYASDGTPTTTNLLTSDLHLPSGTSNRVFSSSFASPVPKLAVGAKINKVIVAGHNAGYVSIGLVIKNAFNVR